MFKVFVGGRVLACQVDTFPWTVPCGTSPPDIDTLNGLREIGLDFVDISAKSDNEPASTSLPASASDEGSVTDDRREQSSGQPEEKRNR